MKDFKGKIAVVTGAGSGMGKELALALAAEGCHLAVCDIMDETVAQTRKECEKIAPAGTQVSSHTCDVSLEDQVIAFRNAVKKEHHTEHINLLFSNAGIGGGGSFIGDDRADWDKVFAVCWFGVYYCARAFVPMLVASDEGHIINVASANSFHACLGIDTPHTAYSTAKFAVKGFSEGLIIDLRQNAPHVKVSVVMPGHIGTNVGYNSQQILGKPAIEDMPAPEVAKIRETMEKKGIPTAGITGEEIKAMIKMQLESFRENAPLTPKQAAAIILDGVRNEQWRILVGEDAKGLDRMVRESPEEAYELSFMDRLLEEGVYQSLLPPMEPPEES
jgi:NAD(P)-dependent dehydrogenase (short-subunit alcohol dehydrogenase family)